MTARRTVADRARRVPKIDAPSPPRVPSARLWVSESIQSKKSIPVAWVLRAVAAIRRRRKETP